MPKKDNVYLISLNEEELAQVYEALSLKDELDHRMARLHPDEKKPESQILPRISREFNDRTSHNIRQGIVESLDDYVDHEIDEEIMWQGIEDQLRKKSEE
jgi:hypothetical protein